MFVSSNHEYSSSSTVEYRLRTFDNPSTKSAMPKKGPSNLERRFDRRSFEVPKRKTQRSVDLTEGRHAP